MFKIYSPFSIIFILLLYGKHVKCETELNIYYPKSAITGSTITFHAELTENKKPAKAKLYTYKWSDDGYPSHEDTFHSNLSFNDWTVTFNRSTYHPGYYEISLSVLSEFFILPYTVATASVTFQLNELLSGNLSLIQNGTSRDTEFVSTLTPVHHTISLEKSDYDVLMNSSTYIRTYWFKNCRYIGQTNGLDYIDVYDKENEEYEMEALVIGYYDKLPDPETTTPSTTTTTTTTTTTSTTTTTTTTSTTTTTTEKPPSLITITTESNLLNNPKSVMEQNSSSNAIRVKRMKREVNTNGTSVDTNKKLEQVELEVSPYGAEIDVKNITKQLEEGKINASQVAAIMSASEALETTTIENITPELPSYMNPPYVCLNKSIVAPDPKKTYGYFRRKIVPKMPIVNLSINGRNWLQHGELLNLRVKCNGSFPLEYCVKIFPGHYNVTGNESCVVWQPLQKCDFSFIRFFSSTDMHSVVFVVRNPVGKIVNQVAINFYEAKKQSQLSVIVVPVTCSLVAVFLVVFGVAYYIQNRNRFIVEVADFNFGETSSVDMEYKTFQRRLLDSIQEVLQRPRFRRDSEEDEGSSSPNTESSLKYGSMT